MFHRSGFDVERDANSIPSVEEAAYDSVVQSLLRQDNARAVLTYLNYPAVMIVAWILNILDEDKGFAQFIIDPEDSKNTRKILEFVGVDVEHLAHMANSGRWDTTSIDATLREKITRLLKDSGFTNAPTWRMYQTPYDTFDLESIDLTERYYVSLHNLALVDTNKLSWETLVEFRKDREAMAALRDLRLFFLENFQDKEVNYITDKLHSLTYRYESASRLWGFEATQKSLSVAISNESVMAGSIGGLAAVLAGTSLPVAAASAGLILVGGCAVEFGKMCIDRAKDRIDSPTRYLTALKRELNDP